ncbi:MAG: DUF1648 domain-containing protein [Oscillospiraceae bacterium]|nr:DUF1648 domain-containing protein [Oscillospiraceae bacterium]
MNKKIIMAHRTALILSILILAASLVFYLTKWNSFPEEIGIHFDGNGQYDVIASRFYGFYPHIVGGILIAGFAFADFLISRNNTGLNISEKGEQHFKTELCLTLDCLSVLLSLFFANWSRCVSLQIPLNIKFMGILELIMMTAAAAGITAEVLTCRKYRLQKKQSGTAKLGHAVCRLIAWLLTIASIGVLAVAWERLPSDDKFYYNPEYYGLAYISNFSVFLDKKILLIPHILIIILLIVLEILSVKAIRTNQNTLAILLDKLKLTDGVFFFWWNLLLASEMSIGIFSAVLFVCLHILFAVSYFENKKIENAE